MRTDVQTYGRSSFGLIQFALGSFYADCPHKRMKGYMERKNMQDSVKNIAFIQIFCVEPMKSMPLVRVFTLG